MPPLPAPTTPATSDPIQELAGLTAVYVDNALDHPDLYRVMFDATVDLEDLPAADATLEYFVLAAARAKEANRLRAESEPLQVATRCWVIGHGLVSLVAHGPLTATVLDDAIPLLAAVLVGAGDEPDLCHRSVQAGWTGGRSRP